MYCIAEELITVKQEIDVMLLTATAVPFWFLSILFLFQITSNIQYLIKKVASRAALNKDKLETLTTILKLGITNSIFAMGALALFPIFWLKKDIPSADVLMVTFFTCVVAFYLLFPVIKLRKELGEEKEKVILQLEYSIAEGVRRCATEKDKFFSHSLEQLETEKELITGYTLNPITAKDKLRVASCVALIPVSWLVLLFTEWLVRLV